jgi:phosphoglucomutase
MNPKEKAQHWLNSNIDNETREAIQKMIVDPDDYELKESFYKDLEFGTGGLRGIMGVGSNRMNRYTVGMATQGLSNYLLKAFPGEEIKVAIAYDSRNNSPYFSDVAASVFSANGIIVYFFEELRPTPQLSFAIRHFGCKSGVVVTASHNPREYNGYKAYWDDGAQVTPPHDVNIIEEVKKTASINDIKFDKDVSKIRMVGKEFDDIYLEKIQTLVLSQEAIERQKDIKIVFSSIHGTGITLVPEILKRMGFENVNIIDEQAVPDGDFPTVVYPNPEEAEALTLATNKGKEIDADLIMATDPDADRVGIAVKNNDGEFQLINGNQTGCLLLHYIITRWKEQGKISDRNYMVKTIVSSELMDKIGEKNNVTCYNTLTGFKYIATIIRELEGEKEFIAGGEESYGYMIGDFVRDKDAVASCAMLAELTAWAKDNGKTVFELLMEIYQEYGFYLERLISVTKKGMSGAEEIEKMMKNLRTAPPETINGSRLLRLLDYKSLKEINMETGEEKTLDFPESNVLQFYTDDGSKISARPSGTEPKIKFYFSVNDSLESKEQYKEVLGRLESRIDSIISDLNLN